MHFLFKYYNLLYNSNSQVIDAHNFPVYLATVSQIVKSLDRQTAEYNPLKACTSSFGEK